MIWRRWLLVATVYPALAVVLTWPAAVSLGSALPGAARSDLWNSLWSLQFAADAVWSGRWPLWTEALGYPDGGLLLVADPVGALVGLFLVPSLGLPAAYLVIVLGRLSCAGVFAHLFVVDMLRSATPEASPRPWGPLFAGVGFASAPVLLSAVHNGTSEAFPGGSVALAVWLCWRAARFGGRRRAGMAALGLVFAGLCSAYAAAVAFIYAGVLAAVGVGQGWRAHLGARILGPALGLLLLVPVAVGVRTAATATDNLVGIKHPRELAMVRRTTGAADPRAFVFPGPFRSPDFVEISRYGEQFVHSPYLGFTLLVGAGFALRRRRGRRFLWVAGAAGLALSMGPVLVMDAAPVIVGGDRAIPLPYFLVEWLPGFSSLSLVYRLALAPALALAVLGGLAVSRLRAGPGLGAVVVCVAEVLWVSPVAGLPAVSDASLPPVFTTLAASPPGAVVNYPVVGGRRYLYEQTAHQHPLVATLNFPNNATGKRFWKSVIAAAEGVPGELRSKIGARARRLGVRYVVVHEDETARPDVYVKGVAALEAAWSPMAGSDGQVRVYQLW